MPEETQGTTPTQETQGRDAGATETPQHGDAPGPKAGAADEKKFTQTELDALIQERLERAEKKAKADAEKAAAAAEAKALAEQGKYKELYEQEKAAREEAESKRRALELSALRRKVAEDVKLPTALADRIRGETEEEIRADAKELLAALPKPAAPNINNGAGGQQGNGKSLEALKQFESWVRRI
jgi:hypothetical protein